MVIDVNAVTPHFSSNNFNLFEDHSISFGGTSDSGIIQNFSVSPGTSGQTWSNWSSYLDQMNSSVSVTELRVEQNYSGNEFSKYNESITSVEEFNLINSENFENHSIPFFIMYNESVYALGESNIFLNDSNYLITNANKTGYITSDTCVLGGSWRYVPEGSTPSDWSGTSTGTIHDVETAIYSHRSDYAVSTGSMLDLRILLAAATPYAGTVPSPCEFASRAPARCSSCARNHAYPHRVAGLRAQVVSHPSQSVGRGPFLSVPHE